MEETVKVNVAPQNQQTLSRFKLLCTITLNTDNPSAVGFAAIIGGGVVGCLLLVIIILVLVVILIWVIKQLRKEEVIVAAG